MTKMTWTRPVTEVQQFAANEYVAACGDTEYGVYKFKCDAPRGTLYYFEGDSAKKLGRYHPCGETHEASKKDEFPEGFVDYDRDGNMDDNEKVIVWLEKNRWGEIYNWHATTNLNRASWVTAKS